MKLLYIHDRPLDSNAANIIQVLHMCCAFAETGQEVSLAIPANQSDSLLIRELIKKKIGKDVNFSIRPCRKISFNIRLSRISVYLGIKQLLKTESTDYCYVRNPLFAHAVLKHGIPTIFESHNPRIHDNYLWNSLSTRSLIRNCSQRNLVKFVAISQNLAERWIAKGVPADKVMVLHDGVDVENFQPVSDGKRLRQQLELPVNKKIVLYAGSLYADRGVEKIFALARYFCDACFVIVGGPEERAGYYAKQAQQQQIRNIMIIGHVPHYKVKEYLVAADVLLMIWSTKVKTINYCSPLKMFEYMAAGRVIVGDDFPTIREVLTSGKNALLADPKLFDKLKATLAQALNCSYPNSMATNARKLAFERYSWKARADKILASLGGAYRHHEIRRVTVDE